MSDIKNPIVAQLREQLEKMGLSTKGNRKELEKRLRNSRKDMQEASRVEVDASFQSRSDWADLTDAQKQLLINLSQPLNALEKKSKGASRHKKDPPIAYYLVFDVEATCQENDPERCFKNEIIEFPIVLIDSKTLQKVDEFHSYVRPLLNPTLSEFCTRLTGISQETVDKAPIFPEVLNMFEEWLSNYASSPYFDSCLFVTDGPWDIRDFITKQLQVSKMERPLYFYQWINVRRSFAYYYKLKKPLNLQDMLTKLGWVFEGRPHSGIDDTRNIARIFVHLLQRGFTFKRKEKMADFQ